MVPAKVSDHDLQRPRSSPGYLTPAAFAANLTEPGDLLRDPDQPRRSLLISLRLHGEDEPRL